MKKLKSALIRFWLGYIDFSGEASRSDFWYAIGANLAAGAVLVAASFVVPVLGLIAWGFSVLCFLPTVALVFRRLHALGLNPLFILVPLVVIAVVVRVVQWFLP